MAARSRNKAAQSPNGEMFALIAGAVGFAVDMVGLVCIISGFVTLPAESFLKNNPFALAVISLCSIVYSLLLLLYFIRRKVQRRWHAQRTYLSKDADERWMLTAAYLLWIPIFLVWSIAIWNAGVDAGYQAPGIGMVFLIFCFFGLPLGGTYLCDFVRHFDLALNPEEGWTLEQARK
ncbi:hypothetical protein [Hyphomicrobium sp. 2TAF46]|uniref:hypothetical protein n=1 Tax=Hyphomicrobium sp. 2TAF46 TaxID=3233019 RepID=UPI003F937A4D